MRSYFSICTMYRDHADDLEEWLEFHTLMGAERFFLYDNESVDHHMDVLAPYIREGVVDVRHWPEHPGLVPAMNDCVERRRHESRWIAFIDIDEFLFSPSGDPLPDVLRDYEPWPGVGVQRIPFGISGHKKRPPGLVIENYLRCAVVVNNIIKSVVDPTRVAQAYSAHHFLYVNGEAAVDELKRPLEPDKEVEGNPGQMLPANMYAESFSVERLRINHYQTKSEEEWEAKLALPTPDLGRDRKPPRLEYFLQRLDAAEDDLILQFAPAVHEALKKRREGVMSSNGEAAAG